MKQLKNKNGITLIALVITIIILLILAGISISSLTNNGLFEKTQDADRESEIGRIKEEIQLGIYAKQLSNLGTISYDELKNILGTHGTVNYEDDGITIKGITTEKGYEIPMSEIYTGKITSVPKKLARVVNVGDYVDYVPDKVTEEAQRRVISYASYLGFSRNTTKQDTLNWRVLDIVKDENDNDCVRLISATPTTSTVGISSTEAYNNGVNVLDTISNILYNKIGYAKNVQNLKIEDIEKHLTYDYTTYEHEIDSETKIKYGETKTYTDEGARYYPIIFAKEKTGWVDGVQGTQLGLSEQTTMMLEPEGYRERQAGADGIKITQTYWSKLMIESDFTNAKYYNLFINDGTSSYCLSSRYVSAGTSVAKFGIRGIFGKNLAGYELRSSDHSSMGTYTAFRPVVTLSSDILIDTTDTTRDGTEAEKAYMIKK